MNSHLLKRSLLEGFTNVGTRHLAVGQASHDTYRFDRTESGTPWALVADGCSSSFFAREGAEDLADIAAELLVSDVCLPIRDFELKVIDRLAAKGYQDPAHHSSTLVTLQVTEDLARVLFFGDGSLLYQDADGCWYEVEVEYGMSAPRFLHYFIAAVPGIPPLNRETDEWRGHLPMERACVVTYRKWLPGAAAAVVREVVSPPTGPIEQLLNWRELDILNIMVCTDGVLHSSMPRAIRESGVSFGFESLMRSQFSASAPDFFLPGDDATFVNIGLAG